MTRKLNSNDGSGPEDEPRSDRPPIGDGPPVTPDPDPDPVQGAAAEPEDDKPNDVHADNNAVSDATDGSEPYDGAFELGRHVPVIMALIADVIQPVVSGVVSQFEFSEAGRARPFFFL